MREGCTEEVLNMGTEFSVLEIIGHYFPDRLSGNGHAGMNARSVG